MTSTQDHVGAVAHTGHEEIVTGAHVVMRMFEQRERTKDRVMHSRPYETVGYVLEGRARLHIAASTMTLEPGDSYYVPAIAEHGFEITHPPFRSVEAIAPPPRAAG